MALCWAFDDEATPFTEYVLTRLNISYAIAPALWPFEVISMLAVAQRKGRITIEQQQEFVEELRLMPVLIDRRPTAWLGQQILPLARAHRLTGYDAAYLELAIREGLPLATLDDDLKRAALAAGVPLVTEA